MGILAGIVGVGLLAALAFFFWPEKQAVRQVIAPYKSFLNTTPAELSTDGTWIRVKDQTTLANKKGGLVWLEFTTLDSVTTSEKALYMNRWVQNFDGLSVITVFSGPEEERLGSSEAEVRRHFKGKRTNQLIYFDSNGTTTKSFEITQFPSSYLIDKEGNVVWEGKRNENLTLAEMKIKEETAK